MNQSQSLTCEENTEKSNNEAVIPLQQFIADFGDGLLETVAQQNPPIYDGMPDSERDAVMDHLLRKPFDAQRDRVQALARLLIDANAPAAVLNGEMGTGKTMMAIALAAIFQEEGYRRFLVLSPPHLVYKWRREILETVPDARVWILNGPDTIHKLLKLRILLDVRSQHDGPEFFIMGRVRMRMGFNWRPAYIARKQHSRVPVNPDDPNAKSVVRSHTFTACPACAVIVCDKEGDPYPVGAIPDDKRLKCTSCGEPLWCLHHPNQRQKNRRELVSEAMCQMPTIGPKTAEKLLGMFGEQQLEAMLADNVYEFINLMDGDGELVFSDRQATRMERALANLEFSFGQGGYQPTEFIKRYLPQGYFDLMLVDEGHEYKNDGSAQGQAMGVLANKVRKCCLLTGTLMGGYADDLFHLLWRVMPQLMIEDGFHYNENGTLGTASMAFMREHGVLKDVYKETEEGNHRTSRGKRLTVRTSKAPGFGPKGVARYVLPFTAFLKLKDFGDNVLPEYREHFVEIPMRSDQAERYAALESSLSAELRAALAKGDITLMGVVLNVLLAWPDCCFRPETVKHPRTRQLLAFVRTIFDEDEPTPKEQALIRRCKAEISVNRRVLVYTTYTGKRDTAARLKALLQAEGLKVSVLRSSVKTSRREDWILEQVERGVEVIITNPELVKTGLDLLEFPTLVFMQTGYNVYTLLQASRRSWRIGQTLPVDVYFFGFENTAQIACLALMAKKIAVSQSTSGDMPETGLESLNTDGDSIEVALAKQLMSKAA